MNASLFARLQGTVGDPERIAIESHNGQILTYGDLLALTGRLAGTLTASGLRPGDRVAVQVEKSVVALALYLATVRAGGVFLPLNTAYTLKELAYFVGDAEPSVIICDPSREAGTAELAEKVGARVLTLDAGERGSLMELAARMPDAFDTAERAGSDLAAILYTSGTTGRSKGAMLSHDNLYSNAMTLIEAWRFGAGDVLIHALPVYHTHGLFVAGNVTLFSGASMLYLPKFDAPTIAGLMPRASCLMGVPTFYVRLLQTSGLAEAARGMRLFVSGSAPLLAETHHAWTALTGHAILERYGMTETNMNTSNPYDGERVPGSVGPALPGVDIRITDPASGAELGPEDVGMIEVRGPNVFKGYWRMPEKTAEDLRENGFFITGDLGKKDADGYVTIIGREKDLIISGGLNIYPKEVEDAIDALEGVAESAVIGVPDDDFGEAVVAVVVRNGDIEEAQIRAGLKDQLARFKQPKRVHFVDELPRNAMGKVQKNLLRAEFS